MTNLKTFAAAFAVAFTLAFTAQASPPAKEATQKEAAGDMAPGGTAKPGEACKTNNDCDQNEHTQKCVKNKCQVQPGEKPLPKPTT